MWSAVTFVVCATSAMALAATIVAARRRFMIIKQSILLWPAVACAILVLLALLDGAQRPALTFSALELILLLLAV